MRLVPIAGRYELVRTELGSGRTWRGQAAFARVGDGVVGTIGLLDGSGAPSGAEMRLKGAWSPDGALVLEVVSASGDLASGDLASGAPRQAKVNGEPRKFCICWGKFCDRLSPA